MWSDQDISEEELLEIKLDLADLADRHEDIYLPLLDDLFTHIYPLPSSSHEISTSTRTNNRATQPNTLPLLMVEAIASFSSYRPDVCQELLPMLVGLSWSEDVSISQAASLAVKNITDKDRIEINRLLNGGKGANELEEIAEIATALLADEGSSMYPSILKKWQQVRTRREGKK